MAITHVDGEDEFGGGDPLFLILLVLFIIFIMVTIGTIGYRIFGEIEWIDAFHNGAMIFTSTSLVTPIDTYNGKIFSAFYNLLSGIFALIIIGIIVRRGLMVIGISTTTPQNNKQNDSDDSDSDDSE